MNRLIVTLLIIIISSISFLSCKKEFEIPGESIITFKNTFITRAENQTEPFKVTLLLSKPAEGFGFVKIKVTPDQGYNYGVNFTTAPAVINNYISVNVPAGSTQVTFDFIVNFTEIKSAKSVKFTIESVSTDLTLKNPGALTIKVDPPVFATIPELRALFEGKSTPIPSSIVIAGVITSDATFNNLENRNAFIQDKNGAIALRFTAAHGLQLGDSVFVFGGGSAVLSEFNRLLQFSNLQVNTNIIKKGKGTLPAPLVITPDQIGENVEGMLVEIKNVTFPAGTFNGSKTLNDNLNRTFTLFTRVQATFSNDPMPVGQQSSVVGNISQFDNDNDDNLFEAYQMILRSKNDIKP